MRWLLASTWLLAVPPGHAGMEISEFMAKNDSGITTSAGAYADWVEVRNDSGVAVDLAGWYLTDDASNLRKWQFPSTAATSSLADGGYLLVFADDSPDSVIGSEIHASFKLSSGGEYLALVEPDGETVAYQYHPEYPTQGSDISYGIDPGTGLHAYFDTPTPGAANGPAIADAVQFSVGSHAFINSFTLILSTSSPTATIRYTLNGSIPTASSTLYTSGIPINCTTRVRARAFDSGLVDGPVVSEIFYHLQAGPATFSSNLPLVVIENFGAGEIPHPDTTIRQPGGMMIIEPTAGVSALTDAPAIASRAGFRRRGESSLRATNAKPSLSVETWGEVDEETRSIKPFGMPAESDWILYAPTSIDTALIRNPFIYEISNEAGQYAVRTRFVEVFLNHGGGSISDSDYYGVYVFMEKIKRAGGRVDIADLPDSVNSEPDISGGYIWKKDKLDPGAQTFSAAGTMMTGVYPKNMPTVQLNWLRDHINAIDAVVPNGDYESLIDVESFVIHQILNVFANNADGLGFSTFYHKDRNGIVHMGPVWDFDRSMSCDNDSRASNPEIWGITNMPNAFFERGPWFGDWANNDPDFWMVWVDSWQRMREGPLSEAAMIARIEGFRTELASAALRNYARWPGDLNANQWNGKVDVMKNHCLVRVGWIDDKLIDPPVFSHEGGLVSTGFQLSISGPQTKYFTLDGSDPRASGGSPAGTTYSSPITITGNTLVKARAGNGANFINAPSSWPWSALTEAMFVVDPAPLAITEIMYHPKPPQGAAENGFTSSDFEFIEIRNTSAAACSLVGVQLLDGVAFDLTAASTLAAGAFGVVVRNLEAFKARYPNWASLNILGEFEGRLSNGGEDLLLGYDNPASAIALADFDYEDDWYPSTDGEGFSLVLRDSQSAPSTWDGKEAWTHSAGIDGSPGAPDPAPAHPPGSLVINEVLTHQDTDNPGDWVEICNTTGSGINIGGWFLSDSRGNLEKFEIPAGTVVPANGYVVFTEFDHFGSAFALSEHGDQVYLSAGSGGVLSEPAYRASIDFGGQDRDVTFGRHVRTDGSSVFPAQASPTMGAANSGPRIGPLVIEEIMYHPPLGGHEYVEIRNSSAGTVDLYDPANPSNVWKVSGIGFEFPTGAQLGAGEALLLVRDTISPSSFRMANQVSLSIDIYGYAGALDNDTDTLVLKKPGSPEPGTGFVPFITVEKVKYNDDPPWPPSADGLGKALKRINPSAYANDSANWMAVNSGYAPAIFSLAVLSGDGDGGYTAGTEVSIQADPPGANQTFVTWIGNVSGIADVASASTTLTIPGQDTTITALYSAETTFIAAADQWRYHDLGSDLGSAWQAVVYDDTSPGSGWDGGPAQLGYGDGDEATVVDFGGNARNKHITTYFRKSFMVSDASSLEYLSLELLRDDGAVVHINGVEALRSNMPCGPIDHLTLASATVGGAEEDTFYAFPLSSSLVVDGINVMAVEIHQKASNSSDVSFAARLEGFQTVDPATLDGDADGLYDAWEVTHFGSTEAGLPGVDSDGDGVLNVHEFVAGTLPGDRNSFFRIEQITMAVPGGGCKLSWIAMPGRVYSVYWTDDLRNPFVPIATGLTGGVYTDTVHATNSVGFYLIMVELD